MVGERKIKPWRKANRTDPSLFPNPPALGKRTREEREEALGPAVDDVNFMERDGVYDFFALLQLSLGALDKLRLTKQYKGALVIRRSSLGGCEVSLYLVEFVRFVNQSKV